jgi:hypothetical protein
VKKGREHSADHDTTLNTTDDKAGLTQSVSASTELRGAHRGIYNFWF